MKKVTAEEAKDLIKSSVDYMYKSNDNHLRERWTILRDGMFYRIEGNTNGFFISDGFKNFSSSVGWVESC